MVRFAALLVGIAFIHIHGAHGAAEYFGRYIGSLSRLHHSVSGEVYAVDARTLHLRDFTYDGEGPAAFFYAGNTKAVGPGGFFVRDENGSNGVLKMYNKKHITITLPEGKTLHNIKWFSVWCDEFEVNFGDIPIPRGLDFPKPQKISPLSGVHAVSSENIVVVDAQTLLIPSFSYDGEAPDAKFWVGRGPKPSPQGIKVPDENGKTVPLRKYDRKTIVLTLPGELTIFDIGHFGVWCEAFTVDFGHVQIPPALNVPPSLKMLGVSPQKRSSALQQYVSQLEQPQEQGITYENVLPLFNSQENVRPTTFRPPSGHRFAAPIARSLFQTPNQQGVQIQSSTSLTPEPIVYTQIANQPLQRIYSPHSIDRQVQTHRLDDPSRSSQIYPSFPTVQSILPPQKSLVQTQGIQRLSSQPQNHQTSLPHAPSLSGVLIQPSISYAQPSVTIPLAQGTYSLVHPNYAEPPRKYLQIPNTSVPQVAYNTIQESLAPPHPLFYQSPPLLTSSNEQRTYSRSLQYLPTARTPVQADPFVEVAARQPEISVPYSF